LSNLGTTSAVTIYSRYLRLTALLVGWSRDRIPVVSLDFSVTYSVQPHHGPGVDSVPSENEYQENFLGVKAAVREVDDPTTFMC
jgi:hypothetical protein